MAFADEFATCMQGGGFNIDAGSVPDTGELSAAIEYLKNYIAGLGAEAAAALDEVTNSDPMAVIFADGEVGAMNSTYVALLSAFDAVSGMPISTSIQWCEHCIQQASSATPQA
jgi:hypothetical protein